MNLPLTSVGPTADLLAHAIDRLHGLVTLVRRTADLVEVLAVIRSGLARAILVAEGAEEFVGPAMDSLLDSGAVVAVIEGHDEDRLIELGAIFIPADLSAHETAEILLDEARRAGDRRRASGGRGASSQQSGQARGQEPGQEAGHSSDRGETAARGGLETNGGTGAAASSSDVTGDSPPHPETASPSDSVDPADLPDMVDAQGFRAASDSPASELMSPADAGATSELHVRSEPALVVVWGPHGSPGRTTIAVNVSAELAADGHAVTLVDLDTWGPSVASLLGLLDESAGVAQACRAADRNRLDAEALERAAVRVDLGRAHMDVLTGLTRSDRWPELRAGSVRRLLQACRSIGATSSHDPDHLTPQPVVVVDVGFNVEEDEELSFDSQAPRRNAATITALEEADLVMAVVAADVLGLPRAAKALPALMDHTTAPVMVVVNKVRRAAAGRSPRGAVREAWEAIGNPAALTGFLPFEPATVDQAALDGSVLLEAAASSTLRSEIQGVARQVIRRLSGENVPEDQDERVKETSLGRRLSGWLRR